jgi:hypothetical protein
MKEPMRDKNVIKVRLTDRAMAWVREQTERYNSSVQAEIVRAVVDKAERESAARRVIPRDATSEGK